MGSDDVQRGYRLQPFLDRSPKYNCTQPTHNVEATWNVIIMFVLFLVSLNGSFLQNIQISRKKLDPHHKRLRFGKKFQHRILKTPTKRGRHKIMWCVFIERKPPTRSHQGTAQATHIHVQLYTVDMDQSIYVVNPKTWLFCEQ